MFGVLSSCYEHLKATEKQFQLRWLMVLNLMPKLALTLLPVCTPGKASSDYVDLCDAIMLSET